MGFDKAIIALKGGRRVARKGWNGKNQYVVLAFMQNCTTATRESLSHPEHDATGNKFLLFVGTSGYQCGWLASQADMLAEDWEVVE